MSNDTWDWENWDIEGRRVHIWQGREVVQWYSDYVVADEPPCTVYLCYNCIDPSNPRVFSGIDADVAQVYFHGWEIA